MYYFRIYTKFMGFCVYTSGLYETETEAKYHALQCEDDEHYAKVFKDDCKSGYIGESAEGFCLGD